MKSNEMKFGIYLSYISLFISNISGLILTPFLIKNLGQSEYGLYILIGAFVGYIAVLDFGLSNTTIRFIAKYRTEENKKDEENFLFATSLIYFVMSISVLIIGLVIYVNLESIFSNTLTLNEIDIAKNMFLILVITLGFTLPLNLFKGIMTGYEVFVFPRIVDIIRIILRLTIIIGLLGFGYKALTIVLVDAIFNILTLIVTMSYVFVKLKIRIKLHQFKISLYKEILSYSSLIFVSVIVDQIYWRIGHLILGIMASTSQVAIFGIGILFAQYYMAFSSAFSGVFLPRITSMVIQNASNRDLTNILIKTGRLQFITLGLILGIFILFGKKFIYLWAGPDFEDAWYISLIVMIPLFIVLTQTIGISILQAKNMHGFRALVYLIVALLNVLVSIYLTKIYGVFGTAAGTTFSLIIGNIIIMNFYYHYKVKLNIIKFYKEVFGRFLMILIITIVLGELIEIDKISWTILILQCLLYSILYFGIMWIFGFNNFEKKLFFNEFQKVKRKISAFSKFRKKQF